MRRDGYGLPKVGPTRPTLGVVNGEIPEAGGLVEPETGGMSVSPDDSQNLPVHRRPPALGVTGKDPVWVLWEKTLPPGLCYRDDPLDPCHGFLEPCRPMPKYDYVALLEKTRPGWEEHTDV
jgi:hypothetical protein